MIILDGKQERHEEAIKLLTHGLGDYDTAISYCLHGGSSIYHPISGALTSATPSTPLDEQASMVSKREQQSHLFAVLLSEFLELQDISERVEQTSSLLERFGGWFDVSDVLKQIPDDWSVDIVGGFLVRALREIGSQRKQSTVIKALAGSENLKVTAGLIEKIRELGPEIEVEAG